MAFVSVKNVSLEFPVYDVSDRSIKNKVFNFNIGGKISRLKSGTPGVIALTDINLELKDGDRVALFGHNGAGKSTLLRLLAGVYTPQRGSINVSGNASTLFNSTLGIDPSATGYENIQLRGLVMGYSRQKISRHIEEISEFSELGDFLNMPVRTYSIGMQLRLAFAITTAIDPDILLIDEFIGVGDKEFLVKTQNKLHQLVDQSNILVTATHNISFARKLCNKALLLRQGKIEEFGEFDQVVKLYDSA